MQKKITNNQQKIDAIHEIMRMDISRPHIISCRRVVRKRTLNQNAGYWLWMTFLQQETGNEKQDLHDFFLYKFPISREIEMFGEIQLIWCGTSAANTSQMSDHMNKIEIFCKTELGIDLPDLNSEKAIELFNYYKEQGFL